MTAQNNGIKATKRKLFKPKDEDKNNIIEEEPKQQRSARPPQTKQYNSKYDFEKVEKLFFNMGYWTTRGSIDFSVGMIVGAIDSIKNIVVGCVEAVKNSKNSTIQSQSKQALFNSATNDLSEADKNDLSQGIKISDNEYRQAATLIDDLYTNDLLKNADGSIEHGEYTFHRTNLKDSNQQYFISKYNSDSDIKVETFILGKDRNVVIISNTFTKEDKENSLNLISDIKQNLDVTQSSQLAASQPIVINDKWVTEMTGKITELDRKVGLTEIKDTDTKAERFETKRTLIEKEGELLTIDLEINKLAGAIEREIAGGSPDNDLSTNKAFQASLGKLKSMSELVENARENLIVKQTSANSLDVENIISEIEVDVEQSESMSLIAEGNSNPIAATAGTRKTTIRTTPVIESYEVSSSDVDLDYVPEMY